MKKLWYALSVLLSIGAAFFYHRSYLGRPFFQDDLAFLVSAKHGLYGTKPSSLLDWLAYWNPWRGWFYRPTFLNYWAIFHSLGLANATAMHAAGLVLHGLVIGFWGLLVYRLTRSTLLAIWAGAAFLIWPGKEEAIWWIASHSTLLATLFSVLTLHLWLSWRSTEKRSYYALALLSFWLALCSKEDAISLIAAVPLVDYAAGRLKWRRHSWPTYSSLLALWLIFGFCTWTASRNYAQFDPYLNGMLHVGFLYRLNYLPHIIDTSSQDMLPLQQRMLALLTFPLLFAAGFTFFRRREPQSSRRKVGDDPKLRLAVFALAWFILAALPVPLAAGAHSFSSRFQYYPMLPASLAATVLFWCALETLKAPLFEGRKVQGAEIGALGLAIWIAPAWMVLGVPAPALEVLWAIYMGAGVISLFMAWKGALGWAQCAAFLAVAIASQASILLGIGTDTQWMIGTILLVGLLHRREFIFGAFLALGLWRFPLLGVALLLGFAILTEIVGGSRRARLAVATQTPT